MKTFRDALRQQDFVVTADLPLQPATPVSDIEYAVKTLSGLVDALHVVDDREAVGHMSSLVAASIVLQNDCDAIVHMTGRDRNRMALQADLLGAAALGITSLVITRGEKLPRKDYLRGKGVFDTHESRLMEMASRISEESGLVSPPGFVVGTYVAAFAPAKDWSANRISQSTDKGTRFLQTQPCLNAGVLRKYAEKLVELRITHRASLIVEIPLLADAEVTRAYKKNDPSALIPEAAIRKMVSADNALDTGIDLCAAMLAEARQLPGVAGANIRYEGPAELAVAALAAVGGSNGQISSP